MSSTFMIGLIFWILSGILAVIGIILIVKALLKNKLKAVVPGVLLIVFGISLFVFTFFWGAIQTGKDLYEVGNEKLENTEIKMPDIDKEIYDKTKSTGEVIGDGINSVSGLEDGLDQSLKKIQIKKHDEFPEWIEIGRVERNWVKDHHEVRVFLTFNEDVNNTIKLAVFDAEGLKSGLATIQVEVPKGTEKNYTFVFEPNTEVYWKNPAELSLLD